MQGSKENAVLTAGRPRAGQRGTVPEPAVDSMFDIRATRSAVNPKVLALTAFLMAAAYVAAVLTPARAVPMAIVLVPIVVAAVFGRWRDVVIAVVLGLVTASLIASYDRLLGTPDLQWRVALIVVVSIGAGVLAWNRDQRTDELRETAQRLRAVVDGVGVGVMVLRPDRTIELASAELASMLGCRSSALRGQSFDLVVVPDDGSVVEQFEHSVNEPGAGFRAVARFADGAPVPVNCMVTPFSQRGLGAGTLVVVADNRQQLRAEQLQQRERAAAEHRQRLELVGQLAGGLAHDFNNLLAAAQMAVELSVESTENSMTRETLEVAATSIQNAASVTRQLLTLSRRDQVSPEALHLNEVLAKMEPLLKTSVGPNVATVIDVDDATPAVMMDETQLEQVLLNLTTNARDAMSNSGVFTIAAGPRDGGATAQIAVTDTGHGMDAETASRAFEAFYTTKKRRVGTGLGLAMVEQIVVAAGGKVRLESEPGVGTTVTITLPACEARPLDRVQAPSRGKEPWAGDARGTVLVVDDQADVAELTSRLLRRAGYSVLVATSAQQALELAKTPPTIDLVLSDVVMPEIDGVELAERLRILHPETPVLFMSGYTADSFGPGRPAPQVDLITKPFSATVLLDAVASHIRGERPLDAGTDQPTAEP